MAWRVPPRRIEDVPPLLKPRDSYPRETEARKYAAVPYELVDANLVLTFDFGIEIKRRDLLRRAPLCMGLTSSSIQTKLADPRVTCLIFASGKGLIVGVKSDMHGLYAAWLLVHMLRAAGLREAAVHGFEKRNVTSTTLMEGFIDLMRLEANPGPLHSAAYEAHVFPGVIMRHIDDRLRRIPMSVFKSGRINITGSRRLRETEVRLNEVLPIVLACVVTGAQEKKELEQRLQANRIERRSRKADEEAANPDQAVVHKRKRAAAAAAPSADPGSRKRGRVAARGVDLDLDLGRNLRGGVNVGERLQASA